MKGRGHDRNERKVNKGRTKERGISKERWL
jgi:hypothetical protein